MRIESLRQDIRYTYRGLRRHPGFFLAAILSLALGMGVNTAIFSATDALLWKPLPVRDPDRTVYVFHSAPANPDVGTSFRAFEAYGRRTDLFAAAMAFTGARPMLMGDAGGRETVYAAPVTSDFFSIADVPLQLGRPLDAAAHAGNDPAFSVILSHRSWTRLFGADAAIVGRGIVLNDSFFTVSGVARAGFPGLDPEVSVDLWLPLTTWTQVVVEPARLTSDEHWLTMLATLRDGVSLEHAQSALEAMPDARSASEKQRVRLRPISQRTSGGVTDAFLISGSAFLAGSVVLALAWTNVASLVIARAAARQREMSIRAALGGSRLQLLRLWLVETAMISVVASVGALVVASWMLDAAVAFEPPVLIGHPGSATLPIDFQMDARVLAFVLGLSALTTIVVSLFSGVRLTADRAIRQPGEGSERRFLPGLNLRSAVLAFQLVLSLVLLIPGGLLVRSGFKAAAVDPGFAAENVLLLPISSKQSGVRVQKPADFDMQLIARVASLPGVRAVTAMDPVPLWFSGNTAFFSTDEAVAQRFGFSRVAPRYFTTLGLPLVRGRDFTATDNASAPPVAIINETLARRFFPGGDALGRTIRRGKTTMDIVGVAADAKYMSLAERSRPWVFQPLAQDPTDNPSLSLAVKIERDSAELRRRIEREVRTLAPAWPAFGFRRLEEGLHLQRRIPRTGATVLGALGAFALVLSAVGIYGVTAYVVTARTREMGIRLALGSPTGHVTSLVVKQVMRVCVPGAAVGTGLALAPARVMDALLVGTSPADPATFVLVPLSLLGIAVLASYLPARQAARTNPLTVLRAE
jgi:predicted permease